MNKCYCCGCPESLDKLDFWDSEHLVCENCRKVLRNGYLNPQRLREFLASWEKKRQEWLDKQVKETSA